MRTRAGITTALRRPLYSQRVAPLFFVTPFLAVFAIFFAYPLVQAVLMSFQRITPVRTEFVGVDNYLRLIDNPTFTIALINTLVYTVGIIIVLVPVPLALAVLLNARLTPLRGLFKSLLFVPALTSVIVAGVIFRLMFGELEGSMANQVLALFGVDPVAWRSEAWSGMLLMILLTGWKWIGVNVLYFLAGLQSIPTALYDAAEVDGAGALRRFWQITLPLLKPISIYVFTITIFAGFRMFEESYVFWQTSSPGNIGLTMVQYIYQTAFQQNDLGLGSAVGVVLLVIVFIVAITYLALTGSLRKERD